MLQSFVAPVINLPASIWIASSCFLISEEQWSRTMSLYSRRAVYIILRDFLLTLNFRARRRFKRMQIFSEIVRTTSAQLHVFESVSTKCLCVDVYLSLCCLRREVADIQGLISLKVSWSFLHVIQQASQRPSRK